MRKTYKNVTKKLDYEKLISDVEAGKTVKSYDLKRFLNDWIFQKENRKGRPINDLACVLSEMFYLNSFVSIEGYKNLFSVKQENTKQSRIASSNMGQITGLTVNKSGNTFGFTIANESIRKEYFNGRTGASLRTYVLTDLNGNLRDGMTLKTSNKELLKELTGLENTDISLNNFSKVFVDKRRWPSIFGVKYEYAKKLLNSLEEEKASLKKLIKKVEDLYKSKDYRFTLRAQTKNKFGLLPPEVDKKIKVEEDGIKEKVNYLEVNFGKQLKNETVEFVEKKLGLETLIIDLETFRKIAARYNELKLVIQILKFNTKATEVSFLQSLTEEMKNNDVEAIKRKDMFSAKEIEVKLVKKNTFEFKSKGRAFKIRLATKSNSVKLS